MIHHRFSAALSRGAVEQIEHNDRDTFLSCESGDKSQHSKLWCLRVASAFRTADGFFHSLR